MSQYYVKNGGNDGNSGLSDLLAWATIAKVNGSSFNAGDSVLFKRGSMWRETLTVPSSGSVGQPIIFSNYSSGEKPIFNGSNLVTGWTNYSGNVWQTSLTLGRADDDALFIDSTFGDHKTSIGALVNEFDWYWTPNTLYLYAPADPDTQYTSPGVETRSRQYTVIFDRQYLILDGLIAEKATWSNFHSTGPGHNIVRNCEGRYGYDGFWMGGSAGVTDCEVYNNVWHHNSERGMGFELELTHSKFYRNECYENSTVMAGDGYGAGMKFWDDDGLFTGQTEFTMDGIEIYDNYLHDNTLGLWIDTVQPPTTPTVIHHNLLKDNPDTGLMVEISSDTHAWANLIINCATDSSGGEEKAWSISGILLSGRLDYATSNNLFYNNTIYGANIGINAWQDNYDITTMRMDNNIWKNNIVANSITRPFSCGMGGDNTTYGSGNVYQYNCFGPQSTNFIRWGESAYYSTYAAWEANPAVIKDGGTTHSVEADPLFTNPSTGDFTLQAGSPCIDAGANLGATYDDGLVSASTWPGGVLTGDQDSYGAGWEIGAYIYEAAGSPWIVGALAVGGS